MGITASNGHSWLGEAQFRCNHMHNSLPTTPQSVECDAVTRAIALEGAEHLLGQRIRKRSLLTDSGNDVIDSGNCAFWAAHGKTLVI